MPTLVGILLDCSKSTKENLYDKFDKKDGKRSRSIFTVIDELIIKENILPNNKMFAIGFGARCVTQTIDIIGTLQQFKERYAQSTGKPDYSENYEKVIKILENGGAYSIRKYLTEDKIRKKIPYYLLSLVLHALELSKEFLDKVVKKLPNVFCAKDKIETAFGFFQYYVFEDRDIDGIVKDVQECFLNDETLIKQFLKDKVDVFDYNTAAHTIRYWFEGKDIDDNKVQKVLKTIEPFIYGDNCLFKAIEKSIDIFQMSKYSEFRKYLCVLSDGAPSDVGDIETTVTKLKSAGVKVISCYVSNSLGSVPSKKLFNEEGLEWEKGAKLMFKLCSTIKTQILPYMIFENYGWSIDTDTNETKLFLQINHPDHITNACETAKKLVSSQDALLELLGDISLSGYIQTANKQAPVTDQDTKKTCYAHAVSAVLHLAMKRIHKRAGGHPNLVRLRSEIENAFGTNGAHISNVLDKFCPDYRLHYRTVDEKGAMKAIASKRPIIATFLLKGREWDTFSKFFDENPTGILTKKEIDIKKEVCHL